MLLNFSDGFQFALGWIVAKLAMSFALGFLDGVLCRAWPWYRNFRDEQDRKKHPWRYSTH